MQSTLEAVTVYRDGSVCTRVARGTMNERTVRIGGFPLSMEVSHLRAEAIGHSNISVLDVRPDFDVELRESTNASQLAQAVEKTQARLLELNRQQTTLDKEISELEGLWPQFPTPEEGAAPRAASVAGILSLAEFKEKQLGVRFESKLSLEKQLKEAHRESELAQRRLNEASSAAQSSTAKVTRAVVITLSAIPQSEVSLRVEYRVPATRWVPTYQLRLERDLKSGNLLMRAQVAQQTGEDWNGVALTLSTSEMNARGDAPELKALKLGRSQIEHRRSGFREAPSGLDGLFESYDNAFLRQAKPHFSAPNEEPMNAMFDKQQLDSERSKKRAPAPSKPKQMSAPKAGMASFGGALAQSVAYAAAPAPPMAAAPLMVGGMMRRSRQVAELDSAGRDFDDEGGPGAAPDSMSDSEAEPPEAPLQQFTPIDDYGKMMLPAASAGSSRGRLIALDERMMLKLRASIHVEVAFDVSLRASRVAQEVQHLALPSQCLPVSDVERFNYAYTCEGRPEVPSNGQWTLIAVTQCQMGFRPRYLTVPSLEAKVFRTLNVSNLSNHALLPGPVDVSVGEEFLLTSTLPSMPATAAAQFELGLGVEEAVKVARKTKFKETSGGFLAGSTVLPHDIEVEIANRLSVPIEVEVREMLPTAGPGEKDLKVEEGVITPPWEKIEGPLNGVVLVGARRWIVDVPGQQTTKLVAQFSIKMPNDKMLVGGNRRSS